jgi:hypothetical protein
MTTGQIISMPLAYRKGTHDLQGESGTAERGRVGRTTYGGWTHSETAAPEEDE